MPSAVVVVVIVVAVVASEVGLGVLRFVKPSEA